jgi:cell division protein FtsL
VAESCVTKKEETRKTTRAAAKRRSPKRRGRSIVAAVLIGFVIVASAVIWRRSYGITKAHDIADMERRIVQLDAERGRLSALIRDESSRTQLGPVVQQLGMRVPDDRQVRMVKR